MMGEVRRSLKEEVQVEEEAEGGAAVVAEEVAEMEEEEGGGGEGIRIIMAIQVLSALLRTLYSSRRINSPIHHRTSNRTSTIITHRNSKVICRP